MKILNAPNVATTPQEPFSITRQDTTIFAAIAPKQLSTIAMRSLSTILDSTIDELKESFKTHDLDMIRDHVNEAINNLTAIRKAFK